MMPKLKFFIMTLTAVVFIISSSVPSYSASESEFYKQLMNKRIASIEDSIRILARFHGYAGPFGIDDELFYLREIGVEFPKDIVRHKDKAFTAGNLAHMMLKVTGLNGGLMSRLFPNSHRYAVRQAIYLGLMPEGIAPEEPVTGRELMGFVSKLGDLIAQEDRLAKEAEK